jgi:phospholipase/carboxylesterase
MIGILGLHRSTRSSLASLPIGLRHSSHVATREEHSWMLMASPSSKGDRIAPYHEELIALARESISANGFVFACGLKEMLVVGYSSGAIFGTALLALAPESFVGAILLRPQPISDDFTFPELSGKLVLIISGLHDNRREPRHASQVAEQLIAANAVVTHHALDAGHGWAPNGDDLVLARSWMDENFPT